MILYNLPMAVRPETASDPGPDWQAMARQIVVATLQVQPRERVVLLADPITYPDLLDAVRVEIQRCGAIELAVILPFSRPVAAIRSKGDPTRSDRRREEAERTARAALFQAADVWILLPHDESQPGAVTKGETEWILQSWRGRGVHFHWSPDVGAPPGSPVNEQLYRSYERAILDLDYAAHHQVQAALVDDLRGAVVRITTPAGTDLTFDLLRDGWYHLNDGDASPRKVESASCARDREEELPCGNVRFIPAPQSVEGVLRLRGEHAAISSGFDFAPYLGDLRFVFRGGRVAEVDAGPLTTQFRRAWNHLEGDYDRLSEVILGTNPLLSTPEGANVPAYWGSGAGVIRFHFGSNVESGGSFELSLSANFFATDATMTAGTKTLISSGRLRA